MTKRISFRMRRWAFVWFGLLLLFILPFSCNNENEPKLAGVTVDSSLVFPPLPPCNNAASPQWPQKWSALALLSPFDGSTMYLSLITYDYSLQAMRTVIADYEGGFADMITIHDSTYLISANNQCLTPLVKGMWKVPAPNWLSSTDHNCAGIKPILNVNVQWWRYQAGNIGNWLWTRLDNGFPWRMMFVNDSNQYQLPLLGNFSMTNFMAFETIAQSGLGPLVAACRKVRSMEDEKAFNIHSFLQQSRAGVNAEEKDRRMAWLQEKAGSIRPDSTLPLPVWPQTFKATSLMTPVNRMNTYPTSISYDWNVRKQLTSMLQPDGSVVNAFLMDTITYLVQQYKDSFQCGGNLPHLGPPTPRWAYLDKCKSKLLITDGPLSPGEKTTVFTCPIEEGRVFWIWYTDKGKPIVFFETAPPVSEGTSLSLADYYDWQPNVSIDPNIFKKLPPACTQTATSPQRFHGRVVIDYHCNQCHNPVNAPNGQ